MQRLDANKLRFHIGARNRETTCDSPPMLGASIATSCHTTCRTTGLSQSTKLSKRLSQQQSASCG
jgi:hypothetical protein